MSPVRPPHFHTGTGKKIPGNERGMKINFHQPEKPSYGILGGNYGTIKKSGKVCDEVTIQRRRPVLGLTEELSKNC
jgi:hypothetical protein